MGLAVINYCRGPSYGVFTCKKKDAHPYWKGVLCNRLLTWKRRFAPFPGFLRIYFTLGGGTNGQQSPLYQLGEPGEQIVGGPPPTKT